jgi:hypothetical protein
MNQQSIDTLALIRDREWQPLPGFPGIDVISLVNEFDETAKTGRRTRLVRIAPGVRTEKPLIHDYHEEALLISGDVYGVEGGTTSGAFNEFAFVHRPPGTWHGPIGTKGGCIMMEIQYYV